jgi:hypothetical protein
MGTGLVMATGTGMVVTMREMGVVKTRTIAKATEVAAAMAVAMESMGWGTAVEVFEERHRQVRLASCVCGWISMLLHPGVCELEESVTWLHPGLGCTRHWCGRLDKKTC